MHIFQSEHISLRFVVNILSFKVMGLNNLCESMVVDLCASLSSKLRFLEAWPDGGGHPSGIIFMALKQL